MSDEIKVESILDVMHAKIRENPAAIVLHMTDEEVASYYAYLKVFWCGPIPSLEQMLPGLCFLGRKIEVYDPSNQN